MTNETSKNATHPVQAPPRVQQNDEVARAAKRLYGSVNSVARNLDAVIYIHTHTPDAQVIRDMVQKMYALVAISSGFLEDLKMESITGGEEHKDMWSKNHHERLLNSIERCLDEFAAVGRAVRIADEQFQAHGITYGEGYLDGFYLDSQKRAQIALDECFDLVSRTKIIVKHTALARTQNLDTGEVQEALRLSRALRRPDLYAVWALKDEPYASRRLVENLGPARSTPALSIGSSHIGPASYQQHSPVNLDHMEPSCKRADWPSPAATAHLRDAKSVTTLGQASGSEKKVPTGVLATETSESTPTLKSGEHPASTSLPAPAPKEPGSVSFGEPSVIKPKGSGIPFSQKNLSDSPFADWKPSPNPFSLSPHLEAYVVHPTDQVPPVMVNGRFKTPLVKEPLVKEPLVKERLMKSHLLENRVPDRVSSRRLRQSRPPQTITANEEWHNKNMSLEEIRLADYLIGRRYPSNTGPHLRETLADVFAKNLENRQKASSADTTNPPPSNNAWQTWTASETSNAVGPEKSNESRPGISTNKQADHGTPQNPPGFPVSSPSNPTSNSEPPEPFQPPVAKTSPFTQAAPATPASTAAPSSGLFGSASTTTSTSPFAALGSEPGTKSFGEGTKHQSSFASLLAAGRNARSSASGPNPTSFGNSGGSPSDLFGESWKASVCTLFGNSGGSQSTLFGESSKGSNPNLFGSPGWSQPSVPGEPSKSPNPTLFGNSGASQSALFGESSRNPAPSTPAQAGLPVPGEGLFQNITKTPGLPSLFGKQPATASGSGPSSSGTPLFSTMSAGSGTSSPRPLFGGSMQQKGADSSGVGGKDGSQGAPKKE
ncbi:hypothetical protein E8E13_011177 [Curvularia kusanoi]|uniref:Uncharacterized protein n=1 Tax=Curvularia kusanoi TaxID=90978 RepID=A0A9P4TKK2_CURKU|nr:hypothetical protein E8E13_011177 [Curvularia kusanoi]